MPNCTLTGEAAQARLIAEFLCTWKHEVPIYAGVCSCQEAQSLRLIMLSPDRIGICGLCGQPVRMSRVQHFSAKQDGEDWVFEEEDDGQDARHHS